MTTTSTPPKQRDHQPVGEDAPSARAGLDAQALDELRALDPRGDSQLLVRVLQVYRVSLARVLAQMAAAREGGDNAAIHMAAHTLKSSSTSIGAHRLASLCAAVERSAFQGRQAALPALLDSLATEAVHVEHAVDDLLDPVP